MSDRNHYSDEMKAGAMAALLAGQSVSKVAQEYSIPVGTVKGWRTKIGKTDHLVPSQKEKAVGELLVDYVKQNLDTLRAQSEIFMDPEWIRDQPASEMAVLHGVLADKTIRILEALTPAEEAQQAA